jgi:hypothetical protein
VVEIVPGLAISQFAFLPHDLCQSGLEKSAGFDLTINTGLRKAANTD